MIAQPDVEEQVEERTDTPWSVVLWDDPVNDMSYVTFALGKVFGYGSEKASQLMLEAHTHGKAKAWTGEREQAEAKVVALHGWTLNATLEKE